MTCLLYLSKRTLGSWRVCLQCSRQKRDMLYCSICMTDRPRTDFDEEALAKIPDNHRRRDARCTRHKEDGRPKIDPILVCAGCSRSQPRAEFDAKNLQYLWEQGLLATARCHSCEPRALAKVTGKSYTCNLCGLEKVSTEYCQSMLKLAARGEKQRMRCQDCQKPPCSRCGIRSETPLPSRVAPETAQAKDTYLCDACLFPNCSQCSTQMNDSARKRRRREGVAAPATWTCHDCVDKEENRRHT